MNERVRTKNSILIPRLTEYPWPINHQYPETLQNPSNHQNHPMASINKFAIRLQEQYPQKIGKREQNKLHGESLIWQSDLGGKKKLERINR